MVHHWSEPNKKFWAQTNCDQNYTHKYRFEGPMLEVLILVHMGFKKLCCILLHFAVDHMLDDDDGKTHSWPIWFMKILAFVNSLERWTFPVDLLWRPFPDNRITITLKFSRSDSVHGGVRNQALVRTFDRGGWMSSTTVIQCWEGLVPTFSTTSRCCTVLYCTVRGWSLQYNSSSSLCQYL